MRRAGRDAHGRFLPGNGGGRGKGWKSAVARFFATPEDPAAAAVANDARTIFRHSILTVPSDDPLTRTLLATAARHAALAAFWFGEAGRLGLATPPGREAQELATSHGQRAERTTVTALDVSTRLAAAKPKGPPLWMTMPLDSDDDEDRGEQPHNEGQDDGDG